MADTLTDLISNWSTTNKPFTKDRSADLFNVELFKSVRTLNEAIPLLFEQLTAGSVHHQEFIQDNRIISTTSSKTFDYTKQGLYVTTDQINNLNYIEWVMYLGADPTDNKEVFGRITVSLDDSSTKLDVYKDPATILSSLNLGGGIPIHTISSDNLLHYVEVAVADKSKLSLAYANKNQLSGSSITFPNSDASTTLYLFIDFRLSDTMVYQFVVSANGFYGVHLITGNNAGSFTRFATGDDLSSLQSSISSLSNTVASNYQQQSSDIALLGSSNSFGFGINDVGKNTIAEYSVSNYINPYNSSASSVDAPTVITMQDYSNIADSKLPSEALNTNHTSSLWFVNTAKNVLYYRIKMVHYVKGTTSNAIIGQGNSGVLYGTYVNNSWVTLPASTGTNSTFNSYGELLMAAYAMNITVPNVSGISTPTTLSSSQYLGILPIAVGEDSTKVGDYRLFLVDATKGTCVSA